MKYSIKNTTDSDITLGSYTLSAGNTDVIFDDSIPQYEAGLTLFKDSTELAVYVTAGDIEFYQDDALSTLNDFFNTVLSWKDVMTGIPIPYLEGVGNAYFDLSGNKLMVYNSLENKWYYLQMTQVSI
jgi:hypothetical protein